MTSFLSFYREDLAERRERLIEVLRGDGGEERASLETVAAIDLASMRNPHAWYPLARSEKRRVRTAFADEVALD